MGTKGKKEREIVCEILETKYGTHGIRTIKGFQIIIQLDYDNIGIRITSSPIIYNNTNNNVYYST